MLGINKFCSYLLGHLFKLVTDHKSLLTLFHQHKPTSCQASAHIQQWSLLNVPLHSMVQNYVAMQIL